VFDHSEHTLTVNVNPEGGGSSLRAIGTLSGGEKSYATVALVLALWDAMEPPFRMLDEFDVFMDMVNRRAALRQIVDYARESRQFQYVLLTPLSTDSVQVDEDISITRLEKNQ
jgi:chromosome segregation ATPase